MFRRIVFEVLRWSGVPFLLRVLRQRNTVTILCYHDPSSATMERHLSALGKRYNFMSLRHYAEWRQGRMPQPPPYGLVITFDDGHRGNAKLRPVFERHGVVATIFLCSAIVGTNRHYWWTEVPESMDCEALKQRRDEQRLHQLARTGFEELREYAERQALSPDEIRDLAGVVDFQSHTRLHPVLPQCTADRAREEIDGSKRELMERYGLDTYALAYPNGDYSDRDATLAKSSGYGCALTIDGGYNRGDTDMFRLKRMRMSDEAGISEVLVKASGLWSVFERMRLRPRGEQTPTVQAAHS